MGINAPSKLERRAGCSGSGQLERLMPRSSSFFADEGKVAHDLGEKCLTNRYNPTAMVGMVMTSDNGTAIEVDEEMANAVDTYVTYCRDLIAVTAQGDDSRWFVERKFDLSSFLGPGEIGYVDFGAVGDYYLDIVDYKHGAGVAVDALDNLQCLAYGLGAARLYAGDDWHTMRITIVQPRAFHVDGPIRTWEIKRSQIPDMLMLLDGIVQETETKPKLTLGDHCMFCSAKLRCPAQRQLLKETLMTDIFDDDAPPPIEVADLEPVQVADIYLNKIDMVSRWVSAFKNHAKEMAEQGNPPPGLKLVPSRPRRYFKRGINIVNIAKDRLDLGDDEARNLLFDKPKPKSVAQVEKAVGRKQFGVLLDTVERRSGGTTLVPVEDERQPENPGGAVQAAQILNDDVNIDDLF